LFNQKKPARPSRLAKQKPQVETSSRGEQEKERETPTKVNPAATVPTQLMATDDLQPSAKGGEQLSNTEAQRMPSASLEAEVRPSAFFEAVTVTVPPILAAKVAKPSAAIAIGERNTFSDSADSVQIEEPWVDIDDDSSEQIVAH